MKKIIKTVYDNVCSKADDLTSEYLENSLINNLWAGCLWSWKASDTAMSTIYEIMENEHGV